VTAASRGSRHLGIDLGATNLKWSVVEQVDDGWRSVDRGAVPTRAAAGPAGIVEQLGDAAAAAMRDWPDVASIGVGVPGLYDPASGATVFLVNLPGDWDGVPVAEPLRARLGVPIALINDARAFGLAELRLGAGRGASSIVGLTLGTGIGGVIALDGRVVMGHDGTAGEAGHQTIDPDGPLCNCGNHGCLEAFARADRLAEACGAPTAEVAVERARAGDAAALAGFDRVGRYLGIGIANLITLVCPDRVVIGGGIAAAGDLLLDPARDEIRRRVRMTSLAETEIVLAELGVWAGAIGAAVHGAEQGAAPAQEDGATRGPSPEATPGTAHHATRGAAVA
jgi:glucokinase